METDTKEIENMEPVESGIVQDAIKGLGKLLGNAFADTLEDIDRKSGNIRTNSDGEFIMTLWPDDENLQPYQIKVNKYKWMADGTLRGELSFSDPSGKIYPNVLQLFFTQENANNSNDKSPSSEDQPNKTVDKDRNIEDFLDNNPVIINKDEYENKLKQFENTIMKSFPVAASTTISLNKIVGSDETTINLLGVDTEQDPTSALMNINSILDDESFIDELPENEVSNYIIYDRNGDDLEVEEYSDNCCFSSYDAFVHMLTSALTTKNTIDHTYYSCSCNTNCTDDDKNLAELFRWQIDYDIEELCMFIKITNNIVPDFNELICNSWKMSYDTRTSIQSFIDCIKLYMYQVSEDEIVNKLQSMLIDLESSLV